MDGRNWQMTRRRRLVFPQARVYRSCASCASVHSNEAQKRPWKVGEEGAAAAAAAVTPSLPLPHEMMTDDCMLLLQQA